MLFLSKRGGFFPPHFSSFFWVLLSNNEVVFLLQVLAVAVKGASSRAECFLAGVPCASHWVGRHKLTRRPASRHDQLKRLTLGTDRRALPAKSHLQTVIHQQCNK